MRFVPTVLRNLLKRPSTRLYPVERREPFAAARGELVNAIEDCIFCGMCERNCPSHCIGVDKAEGVWTCDPFACVYCGVCVDVCPTHCLSQLTTWRHVTRERKTITLKGTPPRKKKKAKAEEDAAQEHGGEA